MLANKNSVDDEFPQEIVSPSRWRGFAILGLGVFLVVFFLNMLVGWYLIDHTFNRGYWIITQKGKVLSSLKKPGYWLIVGDSSGNFGIVPEVLDQHLGIYSVNLCTVADMLTMDDFFMVEEYIKHHGAPSGILMVHAYDAWPRKGETGAFARSNWPIEKIGRFLGLGRYEKWGLLVKRYFPLYSENTTITKMSLMPRTAFFGKGLPFSIYPDGYMPLLTASSGVDADAEFHFKRINQIRPRISSHNYKGLRAIADLAERYRFNVYIVNSPLYNRMLNNKEFHDYFYSIREKLDVEIQKHQRLYMLPFDEQLTFPADKMENVDHVIFSAAEIYTELVAERIQEVQRD